MRGSNIINRRQLLAGSLAAFGPALAHAAPASLSGALQTPVDHDRPQDGFFPLRYEWGRPFVAGRPNVIVVADAQQFYARPGAAPKLQSELFGDAFNVLVPFGRSRAPEVVQRVRSGNGEVDWVQAHRLLRSKQWVGDIIGLRRVPGLAQAPLHLYGRSGGGLLVHEVLATDPEGFARAFTQAAVNPELEARYGLSADRFAEELIAHDRSAAERLEAWIQGRPERRREAVLLLQRQNFFEPLDKLQAARVALVDALVAERTDQVADYRARYQVDAIEQLLATPEGVGVRVRLFEFAAPRAGQRSSMSRALRPDVESLIQWAEPLLRLGDAGHLPSQPRDWDALQRQRAEVLLLAGRHDHTCDYRGQIALDALLPRSRLVLLDDDHVFKRLAQTGRQAGLVRTFLAHGTESPAFQAQLAAVAPLVWREA